MTLPETLALFNACFNTTAAVLLVAGLVAIKKRRMQVHRRFMLGAFGASCLFLASYLTRYALAGDTPYQGEGWSRYLYFGILISHVLLAVAVVPLVLRTLYLGLRGRFERHPRIGRVTLPLWLYVSVTGVVVYLMLYQLPPGSAEPPDAAESQGASDVAVRDEETFESVKSVSP